jgi:carotenoid cleavage dioxygenase-like enzyme
MIHGLNIKDGKATYVARYVQTSKLQQEERYGAPKFLKVVTCGVETEDSFHFSN